MATDFTMGDALTSIGGGVMEEVLHRRRLREQARIVAQQQGFQQQQLGTQQAGATERERLTQEGQNARDANKPAPLTREQKIADALTEYEQKLLIEQKYGVGAFKPEKEKEPKEEKGEDISGSVKEKMGRWGAYRENQRRGNEKDAYGRLPTHLVGQEPPPTYAGGELPYELEEEVASAAKAMKISDQDAANLVYARKEAEGAANAYGIDPRITAIDMNKLRQILAKEGRNISIKNQDGRTNMYWLVGSLLNASWTHDEVSDLLDEYFGVGNEAMQLMQNPTGVGSAIR